MFPPGAQVHPKFCLVIVYANNSLIVQRCLRGWWTQYYGFEKILNMKFICDFSDTLNDFKETHVLGQPLFRFKRGCFQAVSANSLCPRKAWPRCLYASTYCFHLGFCNHSVWRHTEGLLTEYALQAGELCGRVMKETVAILCPQKEMWPLLQNLPISPFARSTWPHSLSNRSLWRRNFILIPCFWNRMFNNHIWRLGNVATCFWSYSVCQEYYSGYMESVFTWL